MTRQLLQMIDWLIESGVTHVAMESTGSYWKPLFNLLENTDLEVLVANPRYMRAVPGRKTDVKDAEWIADLLCHGLLRASFIPSREQRELRELVPYRKVLGQERARMVNRVEKVLEGGNIKLPSVASEVLSKSSPAMPEELIAGNQDAEAMAELAQSRMRSKLHLLREAPVGDLGEHQKYMLTSRLRLIDQLDAEIEPHGHVIRGQGRGPGTSRCRSTRRVRRRRPWLDGYQMLWWWT